MTRVQTTVVPATEPTGAAVPPLAELAYRPQEQVPRSFEVKLIVLASAASALFGLATFVTALWIHLQPAPFKAVAGFQSLASFEFALGCAHAVAGVAVIAGAAAYAARRRACLPLLAGGAAAMVALGAADMVYYTFYAINNGRSGAEWVVWGLWRAGWFYNSVLAPTLLLAVLWRPYVAPLLRGTPRG